jgi:GntR family transcriptional regulator
MVCCMRNTPCPGISDVASWDHRAPIYQQLAELLVAGLLEGRPADGEPMPSVRALASRHLLNPLTVSRALQALDQDGLLENRRGMGFFVRPGACERLRRAERERFLQQEWPLLRSRLRRLGIGPLQLDWEPAE